jgi:ribose transport system substrate-binding protein
VWGTNLYGVQGVITALAEAGKTGEVVVMAPDALPNEVAWIRDGEAYGLIAEKPYDVAYQAVYAALEHLAGERDPVDEPQALEDAFVLLTAENIDDPDVQRYLNTETCPA